MLGRPPSPALKLSRKFWKGETRSTSWRTRIRVGAPRQGIGYLGIFDHDTIELTNLNRQMFFKKDVNKNKGIRLAVNLAAHSTCGTVFEGHDLSFQDALALGLNLRPSVMVCGVDNAATRDGVVPERVPG